LGAICRDFRALGDGARLASCEVQSKIGESETSNITLHHGGMAMRALIARNPFRDLERLAQSWESRLPHLFGDFGELGREEFAIPPIESYVKNGNFIVRADVPGLQPKDVEVSVIHNVLTIKGERREEKEVKKEDYLHREISYGAFERRVTLPEGAATDKVKATFRNGMIEVVIPMAKEVTAKKVPLKVAAEKKVEVSKK
jgi:HSP20 family protein